MTTVINIKTSPRFTFDKNKSRFGFLIFAWIYSAICISHFSNTEIKFPTLASNQS